VIVFSATAETANTLEKTHRDAWPDGVAKVVQVEWYGDQAVKVTFEDAAEFFHETPRHTPRRRLDETAE